MNEQKFFDLLKENFGDISTPQDCALEFNGFTKKIIQFTKIDREPKPPTLENGMITYYVKNVGETDEEVFISPSLSEPFAVKSVETVYVDAVAKGTIIE